jgi:hypothetical protein
LQGHEYQQHDNDRRDNVLPQFQQAPPPKFANSGLSVNTRRRLS